MEKIASIFAKKLTISSRCDSLFLKIAVGYLLLPYFLFFWGWLRLPIALIFILVFLFSYWLFIKQTDRDFPNQERFSIPWIVIIVCLLLVGVWLLYSGVGHFADQVGDYKKHNLILAHLINQDWPIIQKLTDKSAYILVYYLAYYLPAGLVGKLFGLYIANVFQYFFSLLGVSLSIYFVFSLVGHRKLLGVAVVFLLFGGMDILGGYILKGQLPGLIDFNEGWASYYVFQGNTVMFYFAPQQVIPGWLSTLMLLCLLKNEVGHDYFAFIGVLTLLWAPWVFIGLIPLMIYVFLNNLKSIGKMFSFLNIVPTLIIGVICYLYYSSNPSSLRNNFWVWSSSSAWLQSYLVFVLAEFLILGLVLLPLVWKRKFFRGVLFLSTGTLLLIPLYHSGVFNDFCMRASIPSLTILSAVAIAAVVDNSVGGSRLLHIVLVIILVTGFVTGIGRFFTSFERTNKNFGGLFNNYLVSYESNLFKSFNNIPSDVILEQYLARNVDFRKYQWLFKY